jgi:hypothetical protein
MDCFADELARGRWIATVDGWLPLTDCRSVGKLLYYRWIVLADGLVCGRWIAIDGLLSMDCYRWIAIDGLKNR